MDDGLATDGERVVATGRFAAAQVRVCAYVRTDRSRWVLRGDGRSDGLGWVSVPVGSFSAPGDYILRLEMPEDGAGAEATLFVRPRGTHFAVFDVDGTLTRSEVAPALFEGPEAEPRPFGRELAESLLRRGCLIVYLTARAYQMTDTTRSWREHWGFPMGVVHVSRSSVGLRGRAAARFKQGYLEELRGPVAGSRFIADFAFGNMPSDLEAYSAVYPRARTYLIDLHLRDVGTGAYHAVDKTWERVARELDRPPVADQPCGAGDHR